MTGKLKGHPGNHEQECSNAERKPLPFLWLKKQREKMLLLESKAGSIQQEKEPHRGCLMMWDQGENNCPVIVRATEEIQPMKEAQP